MVCHSSLGTVLPPVSNSALILHFSPNILYYHLVQVMLVDIQETLSGSLIYILWQDVIRNGSSQIKVFALENVTQLLVIG